MTSEHIDIEIIKLSRGHFKYIEEFDCGNEVLNNYLIKKAFKDLDSVTYLVLNKVNSSIIAYFSLSCGAIYFHMGSNRFSSYPAVEIKNFAVCKTYQDLKIQDEDNDSFLLAATLLDYIKWNIIGEFTDNHCGARRIILYSTPEAVGFYLRSGFNNFLEDFICDNSTYLDGCTPMMYVYN